MTTNFEQARQVADAVLYEGYVLYPYRASAIKNRYRWQFGVIAPRAYAERSGTDPWFMAAEFLVEPAGDPELSLELRFLQIEERQVEVLLPSGELVPTESLTVADAAAPNGTITAVLVATGLAIALILPAFALLYTLDQRGLLPEESVPEG